MKRTDGRPYKRPRLCCADIRYADGRFVSIMYGVAFNHRERVSFYGQFAQTYGHQAKQFGSKIKAEFVCTPLE